MGGEPEAINEKEGVFQKKKSFADVKGYYKEEPASRHKANVQKSADTSVKVVLDNTGEEKETTDNTKNSQIIQGVVEDADDQQEEMAEPPAKRQRHDSTEAASSTLTSLVAPLINAGRAIFNGLFGEA